MQDLILKWYESGLQGKVAWFIRRIQPSGDFYGEIRFVTLGFHRDVRGKLIPADTELIFSLAEEIARSHQLPLEVSLGWRGLLAIGSITRPTVIFRHDEGDENSSRASACFIQIVNMMRPYMVPNDESDSTKGSATGRAR
jgi:hypothetical protein